MLVKAKQGVHDAGYVYRKGESRSKSYGSAVDDAIRPKRVKTSADKRISRMKTTKEELSDLQNRVLYKRKRLDAAEVTKNYKLCDQLSEEIADLNKSKRLLEVELDMLQKKEKKSKRYYQRKRESEVTAVPLKCQVQVLLLGLHGKEALLLILHCCLSVRQVLLDQYLCFSTSTGSPPVIAKYLQSKKQILAVWVLIQLFHNVKAVPTRFTNL